MCEIDHPEYPTMRRYLACAILAASLLLGPQSTTHAAIIDFGNASDLPFASPDTYTEDGFRFTAVSGSQWQLATNAGNPPSGLSAGASNAIGIGDVISVARVGGGLFTFAAVDYASFASTNSDGVNLIGLVNNVQTAIFNNLTSAQIGFLTLNPNFASPIDELRIVGASQGDASLTLDNFVLNEVNAVPEPGTLALLGVGLFGMAVARRRQIG